MPGQYWVVYYANAKVLVPVQAKTVAGIWRMIDPMKVIDVDKNSVLKRAIIDVIEKGNPIIPDQNRYEMLKITFHKRLGFKSYKAFHHGALLWEIKLNDKTFQLGFCGTESEGRGLESNQSERITFSSGTPVESVVDKLIEIIQETHREKIAEATAK